MSKQDKEKKEVTGVQDSPVELSIPYFEQKQENLIQDMEKLYPFFVDTDPDPYSNDCLVVRVWKSKKQNGQLALNAEQAIYENGNVGHISLQLFRDHREILYMSFWPSISVKKLRFLEGTESQLQSLELDNINERGFADIIVYLFDFNVKQIHEECKKLFNNPPKYSLLPSHNGNEIHKRILGKSHNCCTTVFSLITNENCLGSIGRTSSIFKQQVKELNKQFIQPNDLAEFFGYFNFLEKRNYEYQAKEEKFLRNVQGKILDYACEDDKGSLKIFGRKHPEVYEKVRSSEYYEKIPKLLRRLQTGDKDAAKELKIMQEKINIGHVAHTILQKTESDKEKVLNLISELKKTDANLRLIAVELLAKFDAFKELFKQDIISVALYDSSEQVKQVGISTLKKLYPPTLSSNKSTLFLQPILTAPTRKENGETVKSIYPTIL